MPPEQDRLIVVTGAESRLGRLVRGSLDADGWTHLAISRGDDPGPALERPDVGLVLVLDALRGRRPGAAVRDVSLMLGAILDATGARQRPPRVIVLAYWPGKHGTASPKRLERLAERLRDRGVRLTWISPSFVVGTPTQPGPSDSALRPRLGRRTVPGKGTQRLAPVLLDDLAKMLANAATTHLPTDVTASVGGAAVMTVDDLVRLLGRPGVQPRHVPDWVYRRLPRADPYLPAVDQPSAPESVAGREHFGVVPRSVDDAWTPGWIRDRWRSVARFRRARRRYSRTLAAMGAAGLLVPFGLFLLVLGGNDMVVVADLGRRLTGVVTALAGVFVTAAGFLLVLSRWRLRFAIAIVACAVVVVFSAMLTMLALRTGRVNGSTALWVLLIPLSAAAAFSLRRRDGGVLRPLVERGLPRVLTSLVVGGAVLGLLQFWYVQLYMPATAPPSVVLTPSLKVSNEGASGPRLVTAKVRVANKGTSAVNVVGSLYVVFGLDYAGRQPPADEGERLRRLTHALNRGESLTNFERLVDKRVIEAGEFMGQQSELIPGQDWVSDWQFAVRSERFDTVALVTYLITARRRLVFSRQLFFERDGDREQVYGDFTRELPESGTTAVYETDVEEQSLLRRLVRGQRYVHLEQHFNAEGSRRGCWFYPHLTAFIDRRGREPEHPELPGCDDYQRRLGDYYGLYGLSNASSVSFP